MRVDVTALARPALARGLATTGIPVVEVMDARAGAARLAALVAAGTPGIVVVEDEILAAAPPALVRRLSRQPLPVVLPLPGPAASLRRSSAEDEIVDLLRQAVGYRVRLR